MGIYSVGISTLVAAAFAQGVQVDQRLSRSGGGCGLGLSIVKFIVSEIES